MEKIKKYLTPKQYSDYEEYVNLRNLAMKEGWHHWMRIGLARTGGKINHRMPKDLSISEDYPLDYAIQELIKSGLIIQDNLLRVKPVEVNHCIPYNDQFDFDNTISVCHPSGWFIAELMAGGIHPPIEAFHEQQLLIFGENDAVEVVRKIDAPKWRAQHGMKGEYVIQNSRCHLERGDSMSYDEAIEFTMMKDVPQQVWGKSHNTPQYWIIPKDMLINRTLRNSWKLIDKFESSIS
jgi:hypothetical protein